MGILPSNLVFTWVFTQENTEVNIRCLHCPYSQICEISRNFEKIRTKMGNNPVGKKVNTLIHKYLGIYLVT